MDKGLLQQAMTLATEWIPVILIEWRIVYPTPALRSFAEAAVDRMHPNWEQNFIIKPTDYQNLVYENRKAEAVSVLKRAVKEGLIPSDAPPILRTIQRVHQLFPRILGGSNRAEAFAKAPEEVFCMAEVHVIPSVIKSVKKTAYSCVVCFIWILRRRKPEKLPNGRHAALNGST